MAGEMRIRDKLKSPDVVFSALVAAVAVVVSKVMAAAIASTLVAILVFIIGAAAVLGWGCVFLNHLRRTILVRPSRDHSRSWNG